MVIKSAEALGAFAGLRTKTGVGGRLSGVRESTEGCGLSAKDCYRAGRSLMEIGTLF